MPTEILAPLATVLLLTAAAFVALTVVTGAERAAMVTSMLVLCGLLFYSSLRSISRLLTSFGLAPSLLEAHMTPFIVAWLAWPVIGGIFVLRSKSEWREVNRLLTVIAGVLLITSLVRIAPAEARMMPSADAYPRDDRLLSSTLTEPDSPTNTGEPRDIYYLIFDRYANARVLEDAYGFDNGEFLSFLEDHGFYVAGESHANYLKTAQSLASSLNLEHIEYLEDRYGGDSANTRPLMRRLHDHYVLRYLRARGYGIVQLGSWWEATRTNPYVDSLHVSYPISQFSMVVYRLTFLPYLGAQSGLARLTDIGYHCSGLSRQVDVLHDVMNQQGPKFVFAHILLPHPPFVRDADGRCLSPEESVNRNARDGYIAQLHFANSIIENFVSALRLGTDNDPIVIIQADEGPFPGGVEHKADWREASRPELRQKMGILNAYYLPGVDMPSVLYPSVTPVNTFRIVFNEYFGERFELLEDRAYGHITEDLPYSFFDITEAVDFSQDGTRSVP